MLRRHCAVLCLVAQSCPTLCDPINCSLLGSSVHGDSPGKSTGAGCHTLLQGNFQTQESNRCLLHCRWILYQLNYQGSPNLLLLGKLKFCFLNFLDFFFLGGGWTHLAACGILVLQPGIKPCFLQ